ncbi:proline racemase family protein [Ktedonobacter robiniae]|uniref:Proline racemase n=1 Tax=Ktedonobacter robiniae TaxID=2778365 RepID=A0ABQ3UPB8_9CHLR|nr:proline racemase family protein [Ktedonobacter robiniae]GHO54568.1 proline racemase [Ktedonobacter robiniae]
MKLDLDARLVGSGASVISAIEAHAAGEPLRIITGGLPELPGRTLLERRRNFARHFDCLRKALVWEPRGHHEMYGCVLVPPGDPEADLGVFFLHNEGYSTMCGHGIIALVTALVETGAIECKGQQTPVTLETPAGLIRATAHLNGQRYVDHVSFVNVPSFVYARDVRVVVPQIGEVVVDVAYGGAFYAIASVEQVGLRVLPQCVSELVEVGEEIKHAVNGKLRVEHPLEDELSFLYGTILVDLPEKLNHHSRNVCIFADAEVDRSPTGTGLSARLALLDAQGQLREEEAITVESILGAESAFRGRIVGRTKVGPFNAIVPEVSGKAFIIGRHEFILNPRDKIGRGFFMN